MTEANSSPALAARPVSYTISASPTVAILLSVHNGQAFLDAQLDSFLQQQYENWILIWRDDGSSDGSSAMVQAFAARCAPEQCRQIMGPQTTAMGIAASYLHLLNHVPPDCLVAFSDQDDVWFPDKLARGVSALSACADDRPALYCARQMLADRNLSPIGLSPALKTPANCLSALAQNIATGCTVLLNASACRLLKETAPPPPLILHDWWAYLTVTAVGGHICVDERPALLYRQHGANAVGSPPSWLQRGYAALRRGPGSFMRIFRSNVEWLLARRNFLPPATATALEAVQRGLEGSMLSRLLLLRRFPTLTRVGWGERMMFRLWFLCG
ncbi:glycosyltransferase [Acetobacter sp.]|uniref:glycosyltransferase n=1 Tax=Acetobacter sp. TaxID=440 RepID=UPI0039E9D977